MVNSQNPAVGVISARKQAQMCSLDTEVLMSVMLHGIPPGKIPQTKDNEMHVADFGNMEFYRRQENVDMYRAMVRSYDPAPMIAMVRGVLPEGSTLLELGMGTGADLLELAKHYAVTGSDSSPIFLEDFRKAHPEIHVRELNAADFALEQKFDCIYSNKVLHHLSAAEFPKSLQLQSEHLQPRGIVFMTLWAGEYREEWYDDMRAQYHMESDVECLVPAGLTVETMKRYTEMEHDDSLLVILRKQ